LYAAEYRPTGRPQLPLAGPYLGSLPGTARFAPASRPGRATARSSTRWRRPAASRAIRFPTTCCPERACGSPTGSCSRSPWSVFGAIAQINPIWLFGPYNPAISSNTSQPDWYIGFLEGALRLMPAWETDFAGHTIMWNVFVPGVVLVLAFFLIMGCYPFLEQWATGVTRPHQVLDRPRNMPARTALGAAIVAMAADLQLAGSDDVIAFHLNMPVEDLVWAFRAGFFVLPAVTFVVTRRACIALQRRDRRRLRRGTEFGITNLREGQAYAPVARPASGEERAVMAARRPDELFLPIPGTWCRCRPCVGYLPRCGPGSTISMSSPGSKRPAQVPRPGRTGRPARQACATSEAIAHPGRTARPQGHGDEAGRP
jgi:hypothetical protein